MNEAAEMKDPSFSGIQKVGAAIVLDRKVIALRKTNQPSSEYYMAGGKIEDGETQLQTLKRELDEELGVAVKEYDYIGTYEDLAVFEGTPIRLHAYYVLVEGRPKPANEVKEYRWFDSKWKSEGIELSSILAEQVIPELVARGYID
ncbi:NUDIX hydrolase [Arthrobacter dokdonensis]|uniref:NUDIX hydrolase n=1 Tax=Arthrobacter dokdonellae TaxID=2211210 RepID=UPI001494DE43|nr:NUDIX domain-containing protein [Arthrobacter dokdonellae]